MSEYKKISILALGQILAADGEFMQWRPDLNQASPGASTYGISKGMLFVFFAGVLWSTVGIGIRLMESAMVWQILFYRSFGLSALLFGVIFIMTRQNPFRLMWQTGLGGVIGGLALVAAYTGGIYSIQTTSVGNALLIFASAPLITAILARITLGERVRKATWIAIFVATTGVFIMVADKFGSSAFKGNLAALGSAAGFAIFTITLRRGKDSQMMPAVLLSGLFAIPIMAMICHQLDLPLTISQHDMTLSLIMGIGQVGAGLVLYTIGSKTVPAAELTLLSLAEVVLGPFWVWIILGETITGYTMIGGIILLMAIAGNAISGQRRNPPITPV